MMIVRKRKGRGAGLRLVGYAVGAPALGRQGGQEGHSALRRLLHRIARAVRIHQRRRVQLAQAYRLIRSKALGVEHGHSVRGGGQGGQALAAQGGNLPLQRFVFALGHLVHLVNRESLAEYRGTD